MGHALSLFLGSLGRADRANSSGQGRSACRVSHAVTGLFSMSRCWRSQVLRVLFPSLELFICRKQFLNHVFESGFSDILDGCVVGIPGVQTKLSVGWSVNFNAIDVGFPPAFNCE